MISVDVHLGGGKVLDLCRREMKFIVSLLVPENVPLDLVGMKDTRCHRVSRIWCPHYRFSVNKDAVF